MSKEKFILVDLQEDKAKKLAQVISNKSCRKILDFLADKDATETELSEKLKFPLSTVHYNLEHLMNSGLVVVEEFHYSKKGKEVNHYKLANKYIIIAPKSTFGIKEKLKSLLPVGLIGLIGGGIIHFMTRFSYFFGKTADKVMEYAPLSAVVPEGAEKVVQGFAQDAATGAVMERTFADGVAAVEPEAMKSAADAVADAAAGGAADAIANTASNSAAEVLPAIQSNISSNISNATSAIGADITNATVNNAAGACSLPTQEVAVKACEVCQTCNEPNYALWFIVSFFSALILFLLVQFMIYKFQNRRRSKK